MKDRKGCAEKRDPGSRGLWIAFYGPDGVGKSAVIGSLQAKPGGAFSRCLCFHFRPRFGGRAYERPPVTAPHAQSPRGLLITMIKLAYWLLDCWLGYLFMVMPATSRSQLVVFDRYLPDILVDPMRYRLPMSAGKIASVIVRLAPRPDLNVLLDAPAESVQRRKQEVSLAESQRQRVAYRKLLASLPNTLVIDASGPIAEVTQNVDTAILSVTLRATRSSVPLADLRAD